MRRLLIAAGRIGAVTLVFFVLADAGAALVLKLHERGYAGRAAGPTPDAYFTSASHDWPPDYFAEARSATLRWHPYSYWLGAPFTAKYVNVGPDGLRRTWHDGFTGVSSRRPLRIFLFGGSAMWGYGAPDDDTIASALTRTLGQAGVSARLTNFGQVGYVSTQELILLFEQLRDGNTPDLVIFYDGFNDTASAFQNGTAGITENEVNRSREFNLLNSQLPGQRRALYRRALATFIRYLAIVRLVNAVLVRICPDCLASPEWQTADWVNLTAHPGERTEGLSRAVVDKYQSNIRLIAQTGKYLGYRSLFFWQPALYGRKRLSPFEEKQKADYVPGEEKFFLAVWSAAYAAASDQSIPQDQRPIYLEDSLPQDMPCFIDTAHTSGACNEVVARRIASHVISLLADLPHLPAASAASNPAPSPGTHPSEP